MIISGFVKYLSYVNKAIDFELKQNYQTFSYKIKIYQNKILIT